MRCPSVRPFIYLFVTFVTSKSGLEVTQGHWNWCRVKTNEHVFKIFHHRVATPFQFFRTERHGDILTGTPPHNGGIKCRCYRQRSQFWANIWLHRVLWTLPPLGVIKTVPPDRGKLWHLTLVVSGGVCWWRETTTKCLWQKVSTLCQRQ